MAMNCYTGLQGSGKSFEVVSTVLINALAKGRRVVSNIDGLDFDAIVEYIGLHFKDVGEIGELVHVTNDDVMVNGFFPTDKTVEQDQSVVKPGDLVIIDECWRFWGTGQKISPEHMEFFRMHRHYVGKDSGIGCDVVMMIQDITSLHRSVRAVIEFSTKTVKLKALGLSKRYRIEVYETGKLVPATQLDTFVKRYKPEIFPLYSSYKGGKGSEVVVDDRQNVLKNRKWFFIFGFLFALVVLIWGGRKVWGYFHPEQNKTSSIPGTASSAAGTVVPIDPLKSDYRYVGKLRLSDGDMVVFSDGTNHLRYELASVCSGPGLLILCKLDGKNVTVNSGRFPSSGGSSNFLGSIKK